MKEFHISDVLSVTTPYLLSTRHIDGVYDILNFLCKDNLYTHQLPRASREVEPWLRTQFPQLMEDSPEMAGMLKTFSSDLDESTKTASDNFRIAFCGPNDEHKESHTREEWKWYNEQSEVIAREAAEKFCKDFIEKVRVHFQLPEYLTVYEMGEDMHTHIDPMEELKAMGCKNIIGVQLGEEED